MRQLIAKILILVGLVFFIGCASEQVEDEAGLDQESAVASADNGAAAAGETTPGPDADLTLDETTQEAPPPAVADNAVSLEPQLTPDPAPTDLPPAPTPEPVSPAPIAESIPAVEPPRISLTTITDFKFRESGEATTLIISGDGPLNYTSRMNNDLRQFVVEVTNATLPASLKKTINAETKGYLASVSAQQVTGTNTIKFMIDLPDGAAEPLVQQEGSSLVVLGGPAPMSDTVAKEIPEESETKILGGQNLENFLAGNQKFYGRKISIEMNNVEVREALRFLTEESGLNMVISDDIKGTVSLKLRQIPWDQALVIIMKAKKLSYARTGNILRIAPLSELKQEEEDATKLALARTSTEQLKVRVFSISYAKVDEMAGKIKDFLTERGKVIFDSRTNSIVVTDIEDSLNRISKLIQSLDTQPPQVLIEGKVVEARESFSRTVGINWGASGADIKLGSKTTMRPSLSIQPQINIVSGVQGNALGAGLNIGTVDIFGDLSALLALNEREDKVKVISSPRIVTMTNEKATINQTTQVPIQSATVSGGVVTNSVSFKDLTLNLDVTPQITSDSSILMKVNVKREFQGAIVDAASGAFSVNKREADTRVIVQNGQTAVIGGVYVSDATEAEGGVPWLREVPVLGWLFKGKNSTKEKSELLIFLTPKILAPVGTSSSATQEM